jgi:hypothetical protein
MIFLGGSEEYREEKGKQACRTAVTPAPANTNISAYHSITNWVM